MLPNLAFAVAILCLAKTAIVFAYGIGASPLQISLPVTAWLFSIACWLMASGWTLFRSPVPASIFAACAAGYASGYPGLGFEPHRAPFEMWLPIVLFWMLADHSTGFTRWFARASIAASVAVATMSIAGYMTLSHQSYVIVLASFSAIIGFITLAKWDDVDPRIKSFHNAFLVPFAVCLVTALGSALIFDASGIPQWSILAGAVANVVSGFLGARSAQIVHAESVVRRKAIQ